MAVVSLTVNGKAVSAETAAAMGVSKSTIEKHISAALKRLLARLDR